MCEFENSDKNRFDFLVAKGKFGKWNKQNHKRHLCFIDGNRMNCEVSNLKYVSLKQAVRHINDWVVDWDIFLTAEERSFVINHYQKN